MVESFLINCLESLEVIDGGAVSLGRVSTKSILILFKVRCCYLIVDRTIEISFKAADLILAKVRRAHRSPALIVYFVEINAFSWTRVLHRNVFIFKSSIIVRIGDALLNRIGDIIWGELSLSTARTNSGVTVFLSWTSLDGFINRCSVIIYFWSGVCRIIFLIIE